MKIMKTVYAVISTSLLSSCSFGDQNWACQAMMKRTEVNYLHMSLENNFDPISFSVLISDNKISLKGHINQDNLSIKSKCDDSDQLIAHSCRLDGDIFVSNINNQKYHNFRFNEKTGIFGYSAFPENAEGVCTKAN